MRLIFNSPSFQRPSVQAAIKETHKDQPRNTFGIIDPLTKEKYPDLIASHLQLRNISFDDWFITKTITESEDRHKPYKILLDHKTAKALIQLGFLDVMVSFQVRKTGCFAVARIFDPKKAYKREEQ